jgi:polysaccharide biosynthesis transport protein
VHELQLQVNDLVHSLDEALQPRRPSSGLASRPAELAKPVVLPPWFIDRCRRAYLSLPFAGESRVVGVTSAFRGEGRSSIAIGIATALAADTGEQTLLLECDLERPSFCDFFALVNGRGLSEWLDGTAPLALVRMPYLPHMLMLPAGSPHPDPARLLYQISESNFVGELRGRFRNIVIDLPSMLDVAYSSLAARLADQLLVVVRYGKTQSTDLEQLMYLLGPERVSGIVLNGTHFKTPEWLRRLL